VRWFDAVAQTFRTKLDHLRDWTSANRRKDGPRVRYERVEEFPDRLKTATFYVAGEGPYPWAAAILCPCGCGDVIELNLMEQASPCWSVRQNTDGTITLMPSIWRSKGCRSHFLIRNSRIDWCRPESFSSSRRIRRR
jgi:hypothetical protein